MNNSSLLFKNRYTMMLISAVLSAVLFISMISCGYQINIIKSRSKNTYKL